MGEGGPVLLRGLISLIRWEVNDDLSLPSTIAHVLKDLSISK
jgi:hypothetical protein